MQLEVMPIARSSIESFTSLRVEPFANDDFGHGVG
jgi:hypothetical protein